jgi:hypothetical protein
MIHHFQRQQSSSLYHLTVYPTQLALGTVAISTNVRMLVAGTDDQHLIRAPYVLRVINLGHSSFHMECKIFHNLSLLEQVLIEAYSQKPSASLSP